MMKHVGYLIYERAGATPEFSKLPLTDGDRRAGFSQAKCYISVPDKPREIEISAAPMPETPMVQP